MDTKALRQKILDLAIRGKLVPQDPADEPAAVLLERIRAEKQQMVKDGKLKAKDIKNDTVIYVGEDNLHYEKFSDGTVKCIEDEIPFEIPDGWAWARFSNILELLSGQDLTPDRYNDSSIGIPYITGASNLLDGKVVINRWTPSPTTHATAGDLLLTVKGSGVGKMAFFDLPDAHIARQIMALRCNPNIYRLYLAVLVPAIVSNLTSKANGIIPGISRDTILKELVPIPPFAEQKRIYGTVKDLVDLINQIDKKRDLLEETISIVKAKILDLAIRGKLVPQDPADEPASVLLERIRADKEEQIKAGKIKRDKKESFIFRGEDNSYYEKIGDEVRCIDDQLPFNIPENWAWARLGSIFTLLSGRDLAPNDYNDEENGIPYITGASNFMNGQIGYFRWTTKPQVVSDYGDLLLTCKGTVGELAINTVGSVHIARQIMAISGTSHFNQKYLFICIMAYISRIRASAKGLIPGISREDILELVLPIPPKRHQGLIVEKVDSLLLLLGTIEQSLK